MSVLCKLYKYNRSRDVILFPGHIFEDQLLHFSYSLLLLLLLLFESLYFTQFFFEMKQNSRGKKVHDESMSPSIKL